MYKTWFELTQLPFRLQPDPQFFFHSSAAASAALRDIRRASGLYCVYGERGTGKTTWLQQLAEQLTPQSHQIELRQPSLTVMELSTAICQQLGIDPSVAAVANSMASIRRKLAEERGLGRQVVILVDDAHLFHADCVRLLYEIATHRTLPLVILAAARRLTSNITSAREGDGASSLLQELHLLRFDPMQTRAYISSRLRVAGAGPRSQFDEDAYLEVQRYTGGTPALINRLCDMALTLACERTSKIVSAADIRDAVRELQWVEFSARTSEPAEAPATSVDTSSGPIVECGAPTPRRAQLHISRQGRELDVIDLHSGRLVIGRGEGAHLRLISAFVSREHCCVVSTAQISYVEDLGSTNGIAVNGERKRTHRLVPGDQIQVGDHTLSYDETYAALSLGDSAISATVAPD